MLVPAVFLLVGLWSAAEAASGLGIGLKGGVVTDFDDPNLKLSDFEFDNLKYFGGFLKWGSPNFDLELGAEYYWDKSQLSIVGETHDAEVKDFFVGLTGKYYFPFPLIKPFFGAGVAVHDFTYKYSGPLGEFDEVELVIPDDEAYFGYHLVVGAKLAAAVLPFDLFIEGKMGRVSTDPEATEFTLVSFGLVFKLP
ncbi:MAG: hypothetical protein ABIJ61_06630 [bacterium]